VSRREVALVRGRVRLVQLQKAEHLPALAHRLLVTCENLAAVALHLLREGSRRFRWLLVRIYDPVRHVPVPNLDGIPKPGRIPDCRGARVGAIKDRWV